MQEYWVNVYEDGPGPAKSITREIAIWNSLDGNNINRALYRIHVKMKPPKYEQMSKTLIVECKSGKPTWVPSDEDCKKAFG